MPTPAAALHEACRNSHGIMVDLLLSNGVYMVSHLSVEDTYIDGTCVASEIRIVAGARDAATLEPL